SCQNATQEQEPRSSSSGSDAAPVGSAPPVSGDKRSAPPAPPENVVPFTAPPPPPREAQNVWDALNRKLVLTPQDRAQLINRRGFSDALIDALGFKSNNQSNQIHVESLKN